MATASRDASPIHATLRPDAQAPFTSLETLATRHRDALLLFARFALAYIFIESALNHATSLSGFAATFRNFQLPASFGVPVAALAVVVELLGGIALAVGYRLRETTLLMIVFLLFTIFVGHRYWEFEGAAQRLHVIQIKKNVAIIGGFLVLLVNGGGRYAASEWLARRAASGSKDD